MKIGVKRADGDPGSARDRYGKSADAFAANFEDRDELGAAVVVYVAGRKVVDLWGGIADQRTGRPWVSDTPAIVFSVTKGVLAICAYRLEAGDSWISMLPVLAIGPSSAANSKADITVRMLLSHRAGLAALDTDLVPRRGARLGSGDPGDRACKRRLWPPGTVTQYHTMTYGWLIGEVIRRITGLTRERSSEPRSAVRWVSTSGSGSGIRHRACGMARATSVRPGR